MLEKIKNYLTNPIVALGIAAIAAIIMYYTPDEIDRIIVSILNKLGIIPL